MHSRAHWFADVSEERFVNVSRFLPEAASRVPHHRALAIPQGREADGTIRYQNLTFRELSEKVDQAMHWLRSHGVNQGMLTMNMLRPGLGWII